MPKHRHFEFKDGTSNKFWEIELQGKSFTVRWGRIGSEGQSQAKDFPNADAAQSAYEKLVAEKLAKGYTETSKAAKPAPAPAQPAAADEVVPTTQGEFEAAILALCQDVGRAPKAAREYLEVLRDNIQEGVAEEFLWDCIELHCEPGDEGEQAMNFCVGYADRAEFLAARCDRPRMDRFWKGIDSHDSGDFQKILAQKWIRWSPRHVTVPRASLIQWYGTEEEDEREEEPQAIAVIWRRIEKWTKKNAPKVWKSLRPGATDAQIRLAEQALGLSLPEDYKESCRIHDGQSNNLGFIDGWTLLSLEEVVYQWQAWKDLVDKKQLPKLRPKPDAGVQKVWWSPNWVPVTYSGAGDHHCIDLDPAPTGTTGQIIKMWHDDPDRSLYAPSFRAWLQEFAADLEDDNYEVDEDYGLEH